MSWIDYSSEYSRPFGHNCIEKFCERWKKSKEFLYIHPVKALKSVRSDQVAASSLTYEEVGTTDNLKHSNKHFAGLKLWHDHPTGERVTLMLKENLLQRAGLLLSINPYKHVLKCRHSISQNYGFLIDGIKKEAELRYAYGDPLVNMLCEAFDYKLELEDSMDEARNDSIVTVSDQSKADYICWTLKKDIESKTGMSISVVVLETKRRQKLTDEAVAQLLGYYCKSKGKDNQTGVAILLNEYNQQVEIRLFLFPYYDTRKEGYGIQSLMLPIYKCGHQEFLLGDFIDLFILLCMQGQPVLKLECPIGVTLVQASEIIGVYTDSEIKDAEMEKMKREIQEKDAEMRRKDAEMRRKDAEIKELKETMDKLNEKVRQQEESESPEHKKRRLQGPH